MPLYGLYIQDVASGDLVWFTTEKSLQPGAYRLGRKQPDAPDVYIAESIPALILQVGPRIDEVEKRAQSATSVSGMPAEAQKRAAAEMTDGLIEQLTKTSSIWESEPRWLGQLRPLEIEGD